MIDPNNITTPRELMKKAFPNGVPSESFKQSSESEFSVEEINALREQANFYLQIERLSSNSFNGIKVADVGDGEPKKFTIAQTFTVYPNGSVYASGSPFQLGKATTYRSAKSAKKTASKAKSSDESGQVNLL